MKISNVFLRIITATVMIAVLFLAFVLEINWPEIHAVRWLSVAVVLWGIVETIICYAKTSPENFQKNAIVFIMFLAWLVFLLNAAYVVGVRPWIMLWMAMIIVGADVGGWMFGKLLGGDKMWERLSAGKTWAGQIGGVICGTIMSVFYGFISTTTSLPELIWVGISVALLSQYGDLTASFIKRRLGIKDFSNLLPGHGGILDRFDGWIYVLPLIWFIIG